MLTNEEKISILIDIGESLLKYVHLSKDFERTTKNYGLKESFGLNIQLNHMEIHMLAEIWKHPGISAQELAEIFNRTKGAVSQILKRLNNEGLIIKRENPQNARFNNLYATELGIAACKNHAQHEESLFESLLPRFDEFSRQDLDRVMQAIHIFEQGVLGYGNKENQSDEL